MQPFDLLFLDPPYGKGLGEKALHSAAEGGWVRQGAVAVLEERADAEIALPAGYEAIDTRVYGDTKILVMRAFCAGTAET
jgi:16S rRNA (guanine966-N2)-methyltransferase